MARKVVDQKPPRPRGNGSLGGGAQYVNPSVRAKRAASSPEKIREKIAKGEPHAERGFVRLGPTNTRILTGQEDISTWDDEEILRGMKRDKNGNWTGRQPVVVPKILFDEAIKRKIKEAEGLMAAALLPACKMLGEIIENEDVDPRDRIAATKIVLDRILGKPMERVEVTDATPKWQTAITEGVVTIVNDVVDVKEVDD